MTAIVALRVRDELHAIERVAGLNLTFGVYDWGRSPSRARHPSRTTASTSSAPIRSSSWAIASFPG